MKKLPENSRFASYPNRFLFMCSFLVIYTPSFGAGQFSPSYTIPRDTLNEGLAELTSPGYRMSASVGDTAAGWEMSSGTYKLLSGFRGQANAIQSILQLLSVVSRKTHAGVPFDLLIQPQPISGLVTVEPRNTGNGHTVVFHFSNSIASVASVTALDAMFNGAATVSYVRSGNDVIVNLADVADSKRLTISLNGVNGLINASASMAFLVGDTSSTGRVSAADIDAVKTNLGKSLNNYTFRFDLNADGKIDGSDLNAARAQAGKLAP